MKTIIVSGASGNLGQAISKKFLDSSYKVIGTITKAGEELFPGNNNFETVTIDLTNEMASHEFVDAMIAKYNTIDVVVLTAGGFAPGKLNDTTIDALQHQFKLNFATAFNLAQPLFKHMMERKSGRLFITGARTGSDMRLRKGAVAYGLSKSLIFRLAELMNDEAKGTDVVTTVISPSTIDTPQNRKAMPDADFKKWVKPELIADMVYAYCEESFSTLREPVIKA